MFVSSVNNTQAELFCVVGVVGVSSVVLFIGFVMCVVVGVPSREECVFRCQGVVCLCLVCSLLQYAMLYFV